VAGGGPYSYFRYQMHLAARDAVSVYADIAAEYESMTGRNWPAVDAYRAEGAEIVFIMIGSFATKAMEAVDRMRAGGERVGLIRPRLIRPFPVSQLRTLLTGKRAAAVVDQNISLGMGGVLHAEIASALHGQSAPGPLLVSFIGGLGGRDLPAQEFDAMLAATRAALQKGVAPEPRLLYTETELRELRKLQSIAAGAPREEAR